MAMRGPRNPASRRSPGTRKPKEKFDQAAFNRIRRAASGRTNPTDRQFSREDVARIRKSTGLNGNRTTRRA